MRLSAPNHVTSKYMKQKWTKLQGDVIDTFISKMGIFLKTRLSVTKRSRKQKSTKDIENLNNPVDKFDLIDVYR